MGSKIIVTKGPGFYSAYVENNPSIRAQGRTTEQAQQNLMRMISMRQPNELFVS